MSAPLEELEQIVVIDIVGHPHGRSLTRQIFSLWRARIGLALVALLVAVAVIGPWVAPYSPQTPVGKPNTPPGGKAALGTDYLGQDVLSRWLCGGRTILLMAVIATLAGLFVGVLVGLIAAYSRNILDDILMRTTDVVLAFPQVMLALVAIAVVGPRRWVIVLAIAITVAPPAARVTRGAALQIVESDFIQSADAMGVKRYRILLLDVLPNIMAPLMVEASLRLTYAIGVIAALAFLGLDPDPNGANWGTMIQENQLALTVQPYASLVPIASIALLTVGTGLIGDAIARSTSGANRAEMA